MPERKLQVKICGVESERELETLDEHRVDYAGLWCEVPGRHDLSRERFSELTAMRLSHVRLVAVSTQSDPDAIAGFVRDAPIAAVQAHGFVLPAAIVRLRRLLGEHLELFKVLHVENEQCLEHVLLPAYLACGADAFIIDRFVSRDRIGSSGEQVPLPLIERLAGVVGAERLFVAGGVDETRMRPLRRRLGVRGVDIDSAARVGTRLDGGRVRSLVEAAHA